MKISEQWLRDRVDLVGIARTELLDRLTAAGLEVEAAEPVAPPLPGVVVARILEAAPHPNAAKLQVCRVDAGGAQPVQIVCGAPNARAGLVAPLATVGAVLPDGKAIGAAELRGVASAGMLCSAAELGLDADASGLLELPDELRPGQALTEALALDDVSIEIKLTPNRSDCLGVRGIVRELCALFGRAARVDDGVAATVTTDVARTVQLAAGAACPRYLGQAVVDLRATTTPLWMRERLRRSGIKSIHPLVDITQYVMLETGQPMHAFDLDLLQGGIQVRMGRAGETLDLLDGRSVSVDADVLGIADERGLVALAGVMGGAATRVTAHTRRVFFESAFFAPAAIMGRARRWGLNSDAAYRFERGVDPAGAEAALALAVRLCIEICGGQAGPVSKAEHSADLPTQAPVRLRRARLERVLGMTVADGEVTRLFQALGMQVQSTDEGWVALPPSARFDLQIEEDLIEEVARLVGYEHIPALSPVGAQVARIAAEHRVEACELRRRLVARDAREAVCLAFVQAEQARRFDPVGEHAALANPLSAELAVMRSSLLPGLCAALVHNQHRQQSRVRLFELGRVFLEGGRREEDRIALVVSGSALAEQWGCAARPVDFHDLAGDLQALLGPRSAWDLVPASVAWAHPGRCAEVRVDGRSVGWIAQIHPELATQLDANGEIYAFELRLAAVSGWAVPQSAAVSRFPATRRDLALVLPESVPFSAVEECLQTALGAALERVVLFDVYRGASLPEGSRSLAIGLIFQAHSRTLVDTEVDALVAAGVQAVTGTLGGSIRR